jgi:cobalt-zinc-cadmium efflux system outer membrane protein
VAGFDELYRRAVAAPGIQVLADEARVRQAEIDLAIARSRADIQWRVGVRHFAEGGDAALVASISAPLGSAKRAGGHVQSAKAERQLVGSRREAALLSLRATLFEAWLIRQQAAMQVAQLQQRILPALTRAVEQTRRAYEAGRYSYVEWAGVQRDLLEAKLALIDAATEVLLQQALIEQLTAEPLAARSISELNQD